MKHEYDILIIGGGAAGLTVASGAAQLGAKTALVSNNPLGGDCLFYGCVPSKSIIKSAKVTHQIQHADRFGLKQQVADFEIAALTKRIDDIIKTAGEHDDPERFRKMGVDVIFGMADFWDDNSVCVRLNEKMSQQQQQEFLERGEEFQLSAEKIVIATGSRPMVPPIPGLKEVGFLTNEELFSIKKMPKSLVVIGPGPIGCEMAQAFARLGTKVTLIARSGRILPKDDEDVAEVVLKTFAKEGIRVLFHADTKEVKQKGDKKELTLELAGQKEVLETDEILVATGRIPALDKLKLENAGVKFSKRGIETDAKLRTNKKHIYAIGDVNGKYQFTHTAGYEGGIVVSNAIMHFPRKADYDSIPWATFTDPELASCGLNETEAKRRGIDYQVWTHSFEKQDRALAESENKGFIKILTTGRRAKIIGTQIVGPHAGELIHEFVLARNAGMTLSSIAGAVHVYPTLAEIGKTAAGKYFSEKLFTEKTRKILRFLFRYRG